jgi:predicted XRE-type DNA-binding protein
VIRLKGVQQREGVAQQELDAALGMYQPDVSNPLKGRVSKFSVSKLIKFAGKLDLGAQVKLTKPKVQSCYA